MDEAYFKKTVDYSFRGHSLTFQVSQSLFSSQTVDIGTQRLLRSYLDPHFDRYQRVLDLGSGYGPIGLTLAKVTPDRQVDLVDRDALAVQYSRSNAKLNRLPNVKTFGSLGYSDVGSNTYDLITSNVPAKAGQPVIELLLRGANHYLRPGGLVGIVVVTSLDALATEILSGPDIDIVFRRVWNGHTVLHYQFRNLAERTEGSSSAGDLSAFDRGQLTVKLADGLPVRIQTVYGISDFDTVGYLTTLLLETIEVHSARRVSHLVVLNPGQGLWATAMARTLRPEAIQVVGRDLLGLRATRRNLIVNGYPSGQVRLIHGVGLPVEGQSPVNLLCGVLDDDDEHSVHAAVLDQAARLLHPGGMIILGSSTTAIARLDGNVRRDHRLRELDRRRAKGNDVIVLERT